MKTNLNRIKNGNWLVAAALILSSPLLTSCQKGFKAATTGTVTTTALPPGIEPPPKGTVRFYWTANKETLVNSSGGGYTVTLSESQSFTNPQVFDVPYNSAKTPSIDFTSLKKSTTYYAKVQAYSKAPDQSVRAQSQSSPVYQFVSPGP